MALLNRLVRSLLLPAVLLLGALALPALAQENADCMRCHEDDELYVERDGEEIEGWIDPEVYAASVHGRLDCVDCHQDLIDEDVEHADDLERVNCAECHEKTAKRHAASVHGQALASGDPMAPGCASCHGKHDILGHRDRKSRTYAMNIPGLCGTCHHEGSPVSITHDIPQHQIFENYSQSIHGEGVFEKGLAVTAVCTSCHTSHDILSHTDPRSTVSPQRVVSTCLECHANIEQVHRKVIDGKLWEENPHQIPNCVDCHSPHKIRRPFYPEGTANKDCLVCHGKSDLTVQRGAETVSLFVDEHAYGDSVHQDVGCAQCHVEATKSLERACATITEPVDCSTCHAEAVQLYERGTHAAALESGLAEAPTCTTCHTRHEIRGPKDRRSPIHPRNVPDLCGRCHQVLDSDGTEAPSSPLASYLASIHGTGLAESGLLVTATCVSCHSAHAALPSAHPESLVHGDRISQTCGNCHEGIHEIYDESVHAVGRNDEVSRLLPSCKECHASHQITRTDEAGFRARMKTQCGSCHQEQYESYFETFHGKVSRLGYDRAATCHDCHGEHDIQHIDDPASHVSKERISATCAKCHPGAGSGFTQYQAHGTHKDAEKYPLLFWSFWGMTGLLLGTITFFGLHSLLWMIRLWTVRSEWAPHKAAAREGGKLYRRFTRLQRAMHFGMVVTFFLLAITGMSLKFSYTGWAKIVADLLGGFDVTGVMHRFAALGLLSVFFTHLWDVNKRRKEQQRTWWSVMTGPDSILFTLRDLREFVATVKWFFGRGPRPSYGRWAYWEKFDYFAVLWGIVIIGSTGLLLWFPEQLTHVFPGWLVNVATIVHGDEALLAVAFIFTIHFFNTQFRPDKFPLDPVVFTGRMSLEELKYDKPDEYAELVSSGRLEEHLAEPLPKSVDRAIRVFAVSALAVGILLILLIVVALLFVTPS